MNFLRWMYDFGISQYIRESDWGHPILLCFHATGMAMVVGVVVMLSLRVASGWPRGLAVTQFGDFLRVAQWGFLINFASGVFLFMANAPSLFLNWTFELKIILIALGGFTVWLMWRMLIGTPEKPVPAGEITPSAKLLAVLTIVFWIGAIVSGRYIAYTLQKVF